MEMSQEIKEIAEAMALAQAEVQTASKDQMNPHFGKAYATLSSVWEACRVALTKNGISVIQSPNAEGAKVTVTTLLLHKSGQWFRDTIILQARDASPQAVGSAITYGRRYALSAMASVAPDDDDDGNSAQPEAPAKPKSRAQERPGFDKAIPYEQHLADLQAQSAAPPKPPKAGVETRPQVDLGSFEDKVKSCKVASEGKRASGEPWTLYNIETEGSGSFSTFERFIFEEAKVAIKTGAVVMVHTEPTSKGPKITGFGPVEVAAVA